MTLGTVTTDSGDGPIEVTAGGTLTVRAATGDLTMADGPVYRAGGAVSLTAQSNVALGRVEAGNNAISVTATSGAISDAWLGEGAGHENLVGGAITLVAGSGIGTDENAATDIDTAATSINAQTSTSGIFIDETDGVTLGPVTTDSGGGAIAVTSGGTMTVAQAVTTAGSGKIDLTTRAGNLQVDAEVRAGGDLNLDAAGRLMTADGPALSVNNGGLLHAGRAVSLAARGSNIALGRIDAGTNAIAITAGGAISDYDTAAEGAGEENLVGGAITLRAARGIGTPGVADTDTAVSRIDARTTTGGIFIDETDGVTLGSITTGNGGGAIQVTSGDAMTVAQAVTTAGRRAIRLRTEAGNLQVNQLVRAGGDLSLDAASRLNIAAAVSGSRVGLTGGTGIGHTAAGDVTSRGAITARAARNDISMADGTVYRAGGAVSLTAAKHVRLGRVEAGANPIRVTARTGSISDNTVAEGRGNENLVGGNINLVAGAGVGTTDVADIDTKANRIGARTTRGGIFIAETDDVTLGPVTTGSGGGLSRSLPAAL